MKRTVLLLFLVWLPVLLSAQQIGQVQYGARVFSTGLPHYDDELPENPPMMAIETREKALECIEWTFGKVMEYDEFCGECCGCHHFSVTLEGGDEIYFEELRKDNPGMFGFGDGESDVIAIYEVDSEGGVTSISVHYFEC